MLTLIIIVTLIYSFYTGFRRGLALQLIRLGGYLITLILSTSLYKPLSYWVEQFVPFPSVQQGVNLVFYNEATSFILDTVFYRVVSFILIGFVGWLITNALSLLVYQLEYFNLFNHLNRWLGAAVNCVISFFIIFIFLFVLSLIPVEFIQQQFVNSPLAYYIVSQTPLLSDYVMNAWMNLQIVS